MNKKLFVIYQKDGEFDFEITGSINYLSQTEYAELKSMLITAIGTMEIMRRNKQEEKGVKEERNVR